MSKTAATDRAVLIRLASSLPVGAPERKAVLAGLKTAANVRWKPGRKPMETLWTAQYKGSELEVQFDEHDGEWRGFADGDHTLAVSTADEAKEDIIDAVDRRSKTAALFKAASSKDQWVKLFDELASKRRKTIQLDMTGVMGGGTDGMREFKRGRMGKPKKWRGSGREGPFTRVSLSVIPLDDQGQPIPMRSGYKLWRSLYEDGSADISASIGDMWINIKDMRP